MHNLTTRRTSRDTTSPSGAARSARRAAAGLTGALIATLIAALVLVPALAQAGKPADRFHAHFTDSFSDVLCGVAVDVDLVGTDNVVLYADGTFKATYSHRGTITNPLNGRSVVLSRAGQVSEPAPVVDEQAGTVTFQPTIKGLPLKIQTANGPVLLRDAGLIAFADTFDLATGELIAHETIVSNGPHPEADSDFTRSCEVLSGALT